MSEAKCRWRPGPLVDALIGHFHKPAAELPDKLRSRVDWAFSLAAWDAWTLRQRRRRALDWDAQCEPADQQEQTEEVELGYDIEDGKIALSSLPFIKRMEAKDRLVQLHADFERVSARREARAAAFRSAGLEATSTPPALDFAAKPPVETVDAALEPMPPPTLAPQPAPLPAPAPVPPEKRGAGRTRALRSASINYLRPLYPNGKPDAVSYDMIRAGMGKALQPSDKTIREAFKDMLQQAK